jgi:hypothetical protein
MSIGSKVSASADPNAPKPKGVWGTILTTTPIVLSILATAFGGLSSSEMTKSMYFRSLAAQHQSKAGDQWAFFQAKRIRGTSLETTIALLQSLGQPAPLDVTHAEELLGQLLAALPATTDARESVERGRKAAEKLADVLKKDRAQVTQLLEGQLPRVELHRLEPKEVQDAIEDAAKAISEHETSETIDAQVAKLQAKDIEAAARVAEQDAARFDKAGEAMSDAQRRLQAALRGLNASLGNHDESKDTLRARSTARRLADSFMVASLEYDARRYRQEASLNRKVAELYEVQVRRAGVSSDRHRNRSANFFYSMLIAQLGVVVSTLALARTERSALWFLAALAGIAALAFSTYVYLSM